MSLGREYLARFLNKMKTPACLLFSGGSRKGVQAPTLRVSQIKPHRVKQKNLNEFVQIPLLSESGWAHP